MLALIGIVAVIIVVTAVNIAAVTLENQRVKIETLERSDLIEMEERN